MQHMRAQLANPRKQRKQPRVDLTNPEPGHYFTLLFSELGSTVSS